VHGSRGAAAALRPASAELLRFVCDFVKANGDYTSHKV
jgi:hypothetical protein